MDDWRAIGFYRRVQDQYINQTPMGVDKGPMALTPRLEGYEAALRLYGYPPEEWPWLVDTATMIHRLVHKMDQVSWLAEVGKYRDDITPEDLADADPE